MWTAEATDLPGVTASGATMTEALQNARAIVEKVKGITLMGAAATPCAPGSRLGWLSAAEAAEYLSIDARTLLRWARLGQVRAYRLSGTQRHVWRFLIEDLDNAIMLGSPTVLEPNRSLQ